ncbi:MAG: outer membrane beta-barrel protein [Burkholderiaceae bacterium]|nr:outer membrane beta-barrel protein [Burkholderiaceae bacterium]
MKRIIAGLPAALALLATLPAAAQQAGDTILNLGIAHIVPDASLSPVSSAGTPAAAVFNPALVDARADIASTTTASFSVMHMFTDHLAAELSLGVPPTLDVSLFLPNGSLPQEHPNAAKARAWTPAVVGKWLFLEPGSRWRPYLGLGVAYARFDRIRINQSDPLVVTLAGGSAELSSSWAPVYNAGFIYHLDDRWSINASVSYLPLRTDVTLTGTGAGAGLTTTGRLDINPTDYIIRIGYKF